jgi:hypothetical protein
LTGQGGCSLSPTTFATVSASLWYLRSQCEQQLRAITDALRVIDQSREVPGGRLFLKRRLATDMESVIQTNKIIGDAAQDSAELVRQLPTADTFDAPVQTEGSVDRGVDPKS